MCKGDKEKGEGRKEVGWRGREGKDTAEVTFLKTVILMKILNKDLKQSYSKALRFDKAKW